MADSVPMVSSSLSRAWSCSDRRCSGIGAVFRLRSRNGAVRSHHVIKDLAQLGRARDGAVLPFGVEPSHLVRRQLNAHRFQQFCGHFEPF